MEISDSINVNGKVAFEKDIKELENLLPNDALLK
jgi:hypothetical protein